MMMKGSEMKATKLDKLMALDREVEEQLKRLSFELHTDGYAFTAGYYESLIRSLAIDLQLNQKQMKLFVDVLRSRAQTMNTHRGRFHAPNLVRD
jgi:hypothetical protein